VIDVHEEVSMRTSRAIFRSLVLTVAITATVSAVGVAPAAAEGVIRYADSPKAVPGSYLVVFKDDAVAGREVLRATSDRLIAKYDARNVRRFSVALRGFAAQLTEKQAARLAADPSVAFVEQDQEIEAAAVQSNPPSWGLDRIDQRNLPMNSAYDYQTTAANVHVYVLDSGIRTTHVDFGGRATFDANTVDMPGSPNMWVDCAGHGTLVSGLIGGSLHGAAKGVRLHAVKVLNCNNIGTTTSIVDAVEWVTANAQRPAVVNMSLGGTGDAEELAIANSIASGITYVAAAGNQEWDACRISPAAMPEVISVGASYPDDRVAPFSNYGTCVDVFAPGLNIPSTANYNDTATSVISGTSAAAPFVTAAAALYLAQRPTATPAEVRNHIIMNSTRNRLTMRAVDITAKSPNRLLYSKTNPSAGDTVWIGETMMPGQSRRSHAGDFELRMQTDGNLVLYQDGVVFWHSNTWGNPGARLVFQPDGNLAVLATDNRRLWDTKTAGKRGDRFIVQSDSNLVMYRVSHPVWWAW
jgi:subtilisin family serine protease